MIVICNLIENANTLLDYLHLSLTVSAIVAWKMGPNFPIFRTKINKNRHFINCFGRSVVAKSTKFAQFYRQKSTKINVLLTVLAVVGWKYGHPKPEFQDKTLVRFQPTTYAFGVVGRLRRPKISKLCA